MEPATDSRGSGGSGKTASACGGSQLTGAAVCFSHPAPGRGRLLTTHWTVHSRRSERGNGQSGRGEPSNRDGRGIGGENSAGLQVRAQLLEETAFDPFIFTHGLDHKVEALHLLNTGAAFLQLFRKPCSTIFS